MVKSKRILCIVLVMVLFSLMALGSGNDKSTTDSKADNDSTITSTVTSEEKSGTSQSEVKDTPTKTPEKESFEIGESKTTLYKSSIGTTWVQICVPVKNTGTTNLYLSSGSIDLENSEGHLVESRNMVSSYPQVLLPGEIGWYYEETTLDIDPSSELKAIPHVDIKAAKIDCIRYEVSDITISDDKYSGIKITGRVENKTEKDESLPYVVIFLYDENDSFIGSAFTIMDKLAAGEKKGFSMTTFSSYDAFKAENVTRYEIFAYPFQYQF